MQRKKNIQWLKHSNHSFNEHKTKISVVSQTDTRDQELVCTAPTCYLAQEKKRITRLLAGELEQCYSHCGPRTIISL